MLHPAQLPHEHCPRRFERTKWITASVTAAIIIITKTISQIFIVVPLTISVKMAPSSPIGLFIKNNIPNIHNSSHICKPFHYVKKHGNPADYPIRQNYRADSQAHGRVTISRSVRPLTERRGNPGSVFGRFLLSHLTKHLIQNGCGIPYQQRTWPP